MAVAVLLVCLVVSLVEVHGQTIPFVTFMGEIVTNHSYVNLSLVGYSGHDNIQCHTDLTTCCSNGQGIHRADWYYPDGGRLTLAGFGDIYETRKAQRVDLHRVLGTPSGI